MDWMNVRAWRERGGERGVVKGVVKGEGEWLRVWSRGRGVVMGVVKGRGVVMDIIMGRGSG